MAAQNLRSFVASLGLPPAKAEALESRLAADAQVTSFLENRDSISGTANTVIPACYTLQLALGTDVVNAESVNQTEVQVNWSQACWEEPACIVKVRNPLDVSITLLVVNFFKSAFAVRSGGHSPNPGWSSITRSGILIDLGLLDQITVSSDSSTVWGNVMAALDPYGVSVIGGRIAPVGVGGLILSGGYFHLSPQYGLAADNVKRFEVVLSDGIITNATAEENSDLFWALKGGGPNFGIVTAFELYTIPVRNIWYTAYAFGNNNVPALFEAYAAWQNIPNPDLKATASIVVSLQTTVLAFIYSEPAAETPAAFDVFSNVTALGALALPPTNGTVSTWTQISSAGTVGSDTSAGRHDYRSAASMVDAQLYLDVYDVWQQQATAVNAATGANQIFVIQPFPKNLVEQGIQKGGNPLGMPLENFQCWTTIIDWQNATDDDEVRSVGINTTKAWNALSAERGLDVNFLYMGDSSRDQNPLAGYGAENVAKLKNISAKYDPAQIFQNLQNDGFLLRKV